MEMVDYAFISIRILADKAKKWLEGCVLMITGIKCPYCNKPMRLIMGDPVYTCWICIDCKKEFEYNVFWEKFTAEAPAQDKLLKKCLEGNKVKW